MWAACYIAFFRQLRCSEFTVPLTNYYDPTVHLSLQDIGINSHIAPTVIRLNIKQTHSVKKTSFSRKTDHSVAQLQQFCYIWL